MNELIYSVEVAIGRRRGDGTAGGAARPVEARVTVNYCDVCRRWGASGTAHRCWRNGRRRLSDVLVELARTGRR